MIEVLLEGGEARWQVNREQYASLTEVGRVLAAIAAGVGVEVPVILDIAGPVPMEDVIDVYDLCRGIGWETIQFAAAADSLAME